jgi:hypothetical protein
MIDIYGNDIFESMKGKTISSIIGSVGDEQMKFTMNNGEIYTLFYDHDCCASCTIEDICGDLEDVIGSPLLVAEVVTSKVNPEGVKPDYQDSFTWTFYKLDTIKGGVTIRWYGESNGYYSEEVTCKKELKND